MFGGCFDREFAKDSNRFFDNVRRGSYLVLLSAIVEAEIIAAPKKVQDAVRNLPKQSTEYLSVNEEIEGLANAYLAEGVLNDASYNDALHVATASVHHADVILSWNFRHLVNVEKIRRFNAVNLRKGYKPIDIRSPKELSYEEEI